MKASTNRILTTHTGALYRPPDIEKLFRKKFANEPCDEKTFVAHPQSSVGEMVRKHVEIRIDCIDDGAFSKVDFFSNPKYRLEGVKLRPFKKSGSGVPVNKFNHPAMKLVKSSLAVHERFAQFSADTEPAEGADSAGNVIQMYMPVGTAVEKPALHAMVGPLEYIPQEVARGRDFRLRAHPQIAWAELEVVGEGASLASKELWGHSAS